VLPEVGILTSRRLDLLASSLWREPNPHQTRRRVPVHIIGAVEHIELDLTHTSTERTEHCVAPGRTVLHVDKSASRAQTALLFPTRLAPDVPKRPREQNRNRPYQNCHHGSLLSE
jgi:hypothetical protein